MKERFTDVAGARIRWFEQGDAHPGAPFVLVHGLGSGVVRWLDAIPLLAENRRTIALDLPGFGRSDAPAGPYTPAWLAGGLRAFLDAEGVPSPILVGNSLGGLVSMWLAAAWPQRARGLVLVSPALPNDGPPVSRKHAFGALLPAIPGVGDAVYAAYMRRPAGTLVRESLERNVTDTGRVPPGTVAALEQDMRERQRSRAHLRANLLANRTLVWAVTARREETWRVARSIRVPTVLVWGEQDALIPLPVGERAAREIAGAHLVVIDDCGHNPQLDRPEEFAAATIAFARALEAR